MPIDSSLDQPDEMKAAWDEKMAELHKLNLICFILHFT
jgi:hypothetical protein